jgi:MFS family permease
VLIVGLLLFAVGVGAQVPALSAHSSWLLLLPGLAVMGVGMGVCFAPSVAVAMQDVPPELAGVASGVFNTTRLCGSLLCTALTGALLQVGLARGDFSGAVRTTFLVPVLALLVGALLSVGLRRAPAKTAGS